MNKTILRPILVVGLWLFALSSPARADVTPLPSEFVAIQKSFFTRGFREFVKGLVTVHPPAATVSLEEPVFDPGLSRNEWLEVFTEKAIRTLVAANALGESEIPRLRSSLQDKFLSYHNDQAYARFAYLEVGHWPASRFRVPEVKRESLALPSAYPSDHTLDLSDYVNERFPIELQSFLRSRSAELVLDDAHCDQAFTVQKGDGFSKSVRFMGKLDNPDSQFFFAIDPVKNRVRFVACEMLGRDGRTRLAEVLGPAFVARQAVVIRHRPPAPVIALTDEGKALRFDPARDRAVIGFQNTVWWLLKTKRPEAWTRLNISRGGADVSLFRNSETGERILSVANVYGDEMLQALRLLYARGLRRFLYLGTAGGLSPEVQIGDVLLPTSFVEPDGAWIPFDNQLSKELLLPQPRKLHRQTRQGWVPTLVEETKPRMRAMQAAGVTALDIESRYFAEFFLTHRALETTAVITISDQPLGEVNFNQQSATRLIPMNSVSLVIEQLVGG